MVRQVVKLMFFIISFYRPRLVCLNFIYGFTDYVFPYFAETCFFVITIDIKHIG